MLLHQMKILQKLLVSLNMKLELNFLGKSGIISTNSANQISLKI